ncbi:prolyl oligopeptidase family serine peptidase [Luteimonas sp. R10]|uniref:S9 family peptidase n=1 Tax=Luteimonas sp. R10 TaxID=3108176 RepID=UPI00308E8333|nr:S9 family peptidase [Luteimonas sp. R10]
MRATVLLLGATLSLAAATAAASPVPGPQRPLTSPERVESPSDPAAVPVPLADLFASFQGRGAVWSKDGQAIVYLSTQGGALNFWRQALDGSEAEQASDFPGAKSAFRLAPDGQHVVYQADVGGRAIHDLYLVGLEPDAEPVNLTSTPDVNELHPLFSSDGRWLAFSAREATGSNDNLSVMDRRSGERRQLTHESVSGVHWAPVAFSADGGTLIANRYDYSMEFGEVFSVDPETGRMTRLTASDTYASASDVTPDGTRVAIAMDAGEGVRNAAVLDIQDGDSVLLMPSEWEQKTTDISPDGRNLLFVTNENGREVVHLYDLEDGGSRRLPLPEGVNAAGGYVATLPTFSPDGRHVLFPHGSGSTPLDYWVHDIEADRARRLTGFGGLQGHVLPKTSIVNYTSFDGTVISAVMWMPYNLERNGQAPAVIVAHGGPTGQMMDAFHPASVALASRGYVVLAPNFRGSTGYGQAFMQANQMDLGGGDLEDLVAGVDFLARTGYVDPDRVGIHGGSYGGYMVLMALAKTDVFAAGVDMFGIVNWRTMWERGAPQNRRYQAGLVGEPETHADVYDRSSPLTHLDGLTAPLLVLQGENDPLVPAHESRQVIDYLRARERPVEARFYEEEGHGFAQPENQRDALERVVDWFERHLGTSAPDSGAEDRP